MSANAVIRHGTVVCAGAIVNAGTCVGSNVILNTACSVDHHNSSAIMRTSLPVCASADT